MEIGYEISQTVRCRNDDPGSDHRRKYLHKGSLCGSGADRRACRSRSGDSRRRVCRIRSSGGGDGRKDTCQVYYIPWKGYAGRLSFFCRCRRHSLHVSAVGCKSCQSDSEILRDYGFHHTRRDRKRRQDTFRRFHIAARIDRHEGRY